MLGMRPQTKGLEEPLPFKRDQIRGRIYGILARASDRSVLLLICKEANLAIITSQERLEIGLVDYLLYSINHSQQSGYNTMKGIVFTEFIEMVEDTFSPDIADQIIEESDLPSGGAYTAVATYDHEEIVKLVGALSQHVDIPVPNLLYAYGKHLIGRFYALYPDFFSGLESTFQFLSTIENHVHVEVKKLYPDAELPSFDTEVLNDSTLIMTYRSLRPFADLAEGLIAGSIEHFGENIAISRESVSSEQHTEERFTLVKAI